MIDPLSPQVLTTEWLDTDPLFRVPQDYLSQAYVSNHDLWQTIVLRQEDLWETEQEYEELPL